MKQSAEQIEELKQMNRQLMANGVVKSTTGPSSFDAFAKAVEPEKKVEEEEVDPLNGLCEVELSPE